MKHRFVGLHCNSLKIPLKVLIHFVLVESKEVSVEPQVYAEIERNGLKLLKANWNEVRLFQTFNIIFFEAGTGYKSTVLGLTRICS